MFIHAILCYVVTTLSLPIFIRYMHSQQFGQAIRGEGPAWHEQKAGTPTMGGAVMVAVSFLSLLLTSIMKRSWWGEAWLLILVLLLFAGIGFADDFIKIFKKQNEGLTSKQKFLLQILAAALTSLLLVVFRVPTSLPFFGQWTLTQPLLLFLFNVIWQVGFSNAYNLTDGLDGLATGLGSISFFAYFLLALKQGQLGVAIFCAGMLASLLGFLLFNVKPAKIFMGDVGSLAIGAALAFVSILLQRPWSLLLFGFLYIVETLSVIIQVAVFQTTGKRIFKMSPIHHHFEMLGWSEWRVVLTFWGVQALVALLGLLLI